MTALDTSDQTGSAGTQSSTSRDTAARQTEALTIDKGTKIRRLPERQRTDRAELDAILDAALVAHVALVRDGSPVVLPFAVARDGDSVLLHGSTGGGLFLPGRDGQDPEVCVTVTHLDGLVYARSVFDSSMNYRSAVIFGRAATVPDAEKDEALRILSEQLMPGRWDEVRPTTKRELAATRVLRVPLDRVSVKVRAAGASESEDDGEDRRVWAGVLPLSTVAGAPLTSELTPETTPVAASVLAAHQGTTASPVEA